MFETISVDEIIALAKMQLRLQNTTEHDDWFEILAYQGIRAIDSLSCFTKRSCDIDLVDSKGVLPKGFQKLLGMRFLCDDITALQNTGGIGYYDPFVYVDSKFLMDCSCDLNDPLIRSYTSFVQISNGYLYVNSNLELTGVRMAFMGLNLNSDGLPVVYDYYQACLVNYLCWWFTRAYSDEYKEADIRSYEAGYYAQRGWLRATDVKNDFSMNKRKIGELATALLVSRFENELGNPGY